MDFTTDPFYRNGDPAYIGQPTTLNFFLRVTNIITKLDSLPTDIALHYRLLASFTQYPSSGIISGIPHIAKGR